MRRREFNAYREVRVNRDCLSVDGSALIADQFIGCCEPILFHAGVEVSVFDVLLNNCVGCCVVGVGHFRLRDGLRSLPVDFGGVGCLLLQGCLLAIALIYQVVVVVLDVLRLPLREAHARANSSCKLVDRHGVGHACRTRALIALYCVVVTCWMSLPPWVLM